MMLRSDNEYIFEDEVTGVSVSSERLVSFDSWRQKLMQYLVGVALEKNCADVSAE